MSSSSNTEQRLQAVLQPGETVLVMVADAILTRTWQTERRQRMYKKVKITTTTHSESTPLPILVTDRRVIRLGTAEDTGRRPHGKPIFEINEEKVRWWPLGELESIRWRGNLLVIDPYLSPRLSGRAVTPPTPEKEAALKALIDHQPRSADHAVLVEKSEEQIRLIRQRNGDQTTLSAIGSKPTLHGVGAALSGAAAALSGLGVVFFILNFFYTLVVKNFELELILLTGFCAVGFVITAGLGGWLGRSALHLSRERKVTQARHADASAELDQIQAFAHSRYGWA